MEIIFVLVPISVLLVMIALWAFVWSVRKGQYDDLEKEAFRILLEDDNNHVNGSQEKHKLPNDNRINKTLVNETLVNKNFVDEPIGDRNRERQT